MSTAQPVFKFTYEDYRTVPPGKRYELVDGDLALGPAPHLRHQSVQVRLGERLPRFVRENSRGMLFFAPCDVVLSDTDVVQPDLLFVSRDRAHLLGNGENVRGAPDLVVEILSPATAGQDRGYKRALREARRGRVLAGRSFRRDRVHSPPARPRAGGCADLQPETDATLGSAVGIRSGTGRRLFVLNLLRDRVRSPRRPTSHREGSFQGNSFLDRLWAGAWSDAP